VQWGLLANHKGNEGEGPVSLSLHKMPRWRVSLDNARNCADEAAVCRYNMGFSPVLRANQVGQLIARRKRDWPRITHACRLDSRVLAMVITLYSGEQRGCCIAFRASIQIRAERSVLAVMSRVAWQRVPIP